MNDFARHNTYVEWKKQAKWCDFLRYNIMDIKDKITVQINYIDKMSKFSTDVEYINNSDDVYLGNNIEYRDELIGNLKDYRDQLKLEEIKCKELKNEYMLRTV